MTNKIQNLQRKREKAHRRAKRTNLQQHWTNFKKKRNEVQAEIRRAKAKQIKQLAEKIQECYSQDEKLWWKITKRFYSN